MKLTTLEKKELAELEAKMQKARETRSGSSSKDFDRHWELTAKQGLFKAKKR